MLNPRSSSETRSSLVDEAGDGAGLRHRGDVERAAVGTDLELLFEVADDSTVGLVVGLRVDQVVEDLLVRRCLLWLRRTQQVHLTGVRLEVRRTLPPPVVVPLLLPLSSPQAAAVSVSATSTAATRPHFIYVPSLGVVIGQLSCRRWLSCPLGRRSAADGCRPPVRWARPSRARCAGSAGPPCWCGCPRCRRRSGSRCRRQAL